MGLTHQLFWQCYSAARGRVMDVADRALRALVQVGAHPSPALCGEVLVVAADVNDCELALRALTYAGNAHLDEGALLAAMGCAARGRHAALADAAWAALQATTAARGVPPSAASYASLLACRAACGDVEGAFRALHSLQAVAQELPPSALAPLVAACAGGPEALDAAYYTVQRLHAAGEGAGVAALNVVVAACAKAGDVQRAFETFEEIEGPTFGLAPTTASYNALLGACVWHGHAFAAQRLEEEMRAKGVLPDATTAGLLIDAALAQRDLAGAMARLDGELPARDAMRRLLAYTRRAGDEAARAAVLQAMRREHEA
jgi:pentatricopeptide repeat protein